MTSERLQSEQKGRQFVSALRFGDVFPYEERTDIEPNIIQLVFIDNPNAPDCLRVVGDINGEYTLHHTGSVSFDRIVRQIVIRLSCNEIKDHFQSWDDASRDAILTEIENIHLTNKS